MSLYFPMAVAEDDAMLFIRDAEVEDVLTEMAKIIFKVAKLNPDTARVYVIHSSQINAFTLGNGYIFINSGLLLKFTNPLHLIAIMCHETAHVAAGHINRLMAALQARNRNFTAAAMAGILGSVIIGSPAAMAILLGYAISDERFFLKYSRGEEFAADALAARYLIALGYSPTALMEILYEFDHMDLLSGGVNLPIYVVSHPRAADRISAIRKFSSAGKSAGVVAEDLAERYRRIIVKLKSYLKPIEFQTQLPEDPYARVVHLQRTGKISTATAIMRKLVQDNPSDIYYKETLAQLMYESGQLSEAAKIYQSICRLDVNVLTRIDYANVLVEEGKNLDEAVSILESVKHKDPLNETIFRLLAKCYGKKGKNALSMLMLAREQTLLRNYSRANDLLDCCFKMFDAKTEQSYIKQARELQQMLRRDLIPG
ncbi:MAG: M48 family metalloprotease [Holosporaceae bacterium]|nr:M48 family metalloprotease [Holosporaceae bacterium]